MVRFLRHREIERRIRQHPYRENDNRKSNKLKEKTTTLTQTAVKKKINSHVNNFCLQNFINFTTSIRTVTSNEHVNVEKQQQQNSPKRSH